MLNPNCSVTQTLYPPPVLESYFLGSGLRKKFDAGEVGQTAQDFSDGGERGHWGTRFRRPRRVRKATIGGHKIGVAIPKQIPYAEEERKFSVYEASRLLFSSRVTWGKLAPSDNVSI